MTGSTPCMSATSPKNETDSFLQLLVAGREDFCYSRDTCVSDENLLEEYRCSAYMLTHTASGPSALILHFIKG